jgi:hypothetical protein
LLSAIPSFIALLLQIPSPPSNNTIHQAQTNSNTTQTQNHAQPVGAAITNTRNRPDGKESTYYQYHAEQGPNRGLATPEWFTAFATFVYALAAIGTLLAILHQAKLMRMGLEETKKAASAAVSSSNVAQSIAAATASQFELTERPWLSVDVEIATDLTYNITTG